MYMPVGRRGVLTLAAVRMRMRAARHRRGVTACADNQVQGQPTLSSGPQHRSGPFQYAITGDCQERLQAENRPRMSCCPGMSVASAPGPTRVLRVCCSIARSLRSRTLYRPNCAHEEHIRVNCVRNTFQPRRKSSAQWHRRWNGTASQY